MGVAGTVGAPPRSPWIPLLALCSALPASVLFASKACTCVCPLAAALGFLHTCRQLEVPGSLHPWGGP